MHKEGRNCKACVLLENFWWKVIYVSLCVLLFWSSSMFFVLSFVPRMSSGVESHLVKNCRAVIYCALLAFWWTLWGKAFLVKKSCFGLCYNGVLTFIGEETL